MNELLESLQSMSLAELEKLRASLSADPQSHKRLGNQKKRPASKPVIMHINRQHVTARESDVIQHYLETQLPKITQVPVSSIKGAFVEFCEMLAGLRDDSDEEGRMKWRSRAARVVMIDNRDQLINYIVTLTVGIRPR